MSKYHPSEDELKALSSMHAGTKFASSVLGGALLAAQFIVAFSSLFVFIGMPKDKRLGRLRFILIGFLILITSAAHTCMDFWLYYRALSGISVHQLDLTIGLISDVLLTVAMAVGDLLLLWRCLVLWRHKRWVVILPFLTLLGSVAMTVVCTLAAIRYDANFSRNAGVASGSLGVATNTMITLLILLRVGITWKSTREAFPDRKQPHMYATIAATLIESAAPLAIFGTLLVIGRGIRTSEIKDILTRGRINIFSELVGWLYYGFCALSPLMIIFRVTTGRSWKDASESEYGVGAMSQPIQFACSVTRDQTSRSRDDVSWT
ncbi:hypothetical protein BKA70DRAFT_1267279 [Coprinopsis sp. MPI-PUGE-AT-0042]|nr:hypothetical protein BKA70DRAFT_1267279 [Coprinopsis sp. MPI-PUGE-AT-0042]